MSNFQADFEAAGKKYRVDPTTANFEALMRAERRLSEHENGREASSSLEDFEDQIHDATTVAPTTGHNSPTYGHPKVLVNGEIPGAPSKSKRSPSKEQLESL